MLITWLINGLTLFAVAYLLPGIDFDGVSAVAIAAALLGLVNTFLRPILHLLSLPLTLATFGLFAFVLNALLLMLVAALVPGFEVDGFVAALLGSVLLSLVGAVLAWIIR